jgi:SAM-dependent methyltransferase
VKPMADSDFGRTADDYRRYRAGFPDSLFQRLTAYGVGLSGQFLVDLGTGTGSLSRGFASRGVVAAGIDPDPQMLAQARLIDAELGVSVRYLRARAESTGLASSSVDVVTAGQCWHWFDRPRAAREVGRILKPTGKVLIAHFDWLPLKGNCVEATEKLILEHSPEWKGAGGWGMHPWWLRDLGEAGFANIETFSYDEDVPYSHEGWRGRIRASAGIASLPEEQRDAFDRALASLLREFFAHEPLSTPHRVFAVIADAH